MVCWIGLDKRMHISEPLKPAAFDRFAYSVFPFFKARRREHSFKSVRYDD